MLVDEPPRRQLGGSVADHRRGKPEDYVPPSHRAQDAVCSASTRYHWLARAPGIDSSSLAPTADPCAPAPTVLVWKESYPRALPAA